jgi:hypothetical protein
MFDWIEPFFKKLILLAKKKPLKRRKKMASVKYKIMI